MFLLRIEGPFLIKREQREVMATFYVAYFFSSVTWHSYTLQMKGPRKPGMVIFSIIHLRLSSVCCVSKQ